MPFARLHQGKPFRDAAGDGEDQSHCHVGGILGQDVRRIGDDQAFRLGGIEVEAQHVRDHVH